jgi:hypothetical protein
VIVVSATTTIAALAWPALLAMREASRRRRAVRKLPYAAGPVVAVEPDRPACSHAVPHDAVDGDQPSPIARDDQTPWHAAQGAAPWQADSSADHPHHAPLRTQPAVVMSQTAAPMIAMDTAPHGTIASAASSYDQPDDAEPVTSSDVNASLLSAASPDMAMVSINPPAGVTVANSASSLLTMDDAAAADCREARSPSASTLVAAGEHAAAMVMLTPPTDTMLALLSMDGALDEAAVDALVHAGRHDDAAAAPGVAAPSHEQPDDADRGTVDEPDWWEQAVVVIETPPSIVTLSSRRSAINRR